MFLLGFLIVVTHVPGVSIWLPSLLFATPALCGHCETLEIAGAAQVRVYVE
jgi:hypothetical protein